MFSKSEETLNKVLSSILSLVSLSKELETLYHKLVFFVTIGEEIYDASNEFKLDCVQDKMVQDKQMTNIWGIFVGKTHETYKFYKFPLWKLEVLESSEISITRKNSNFGQSQGRLFVTKSYTLSKKNYSQISDLL